MALRRMLQQDGDGDGDDNGDEYNEDELDG